jgi:hypothetical protein
VRAEGPTWQGFDDGRVDREGNYRLEHLLPGAYRVVATVAGTGRQARDQVTVEEGAQEVRLDLQFGGGVTLSGRALQGDTPISGAMLYAEGIDIDHDALSQTDHQGGFALEGLEPGSYTLQLRDWQTGLFHKETVEVATSREIVLEVPTAGVAGRVVDAADRQPLAGVTLTLTSAGEGATGNVPPHVATTDLEGRFTVRHVADGDWKLSADKQGYAAVSMPVTVQFERPVDDLQVSMNPTEGLNLEVRLPTGGVPGEISVAVLDPAGGALVSGSYATGENGRVRLSTVPPGSWVLIVSAAGSAVTRVRAEAPGAAVPVLLQPACRLSVQVPELTESSTVATVSLEGDDGQPFQSLSWTGSPRSEWRLSSGRIEFGSLPPGNWRVTVAAADGRSWQGSSTTSAATSAELLLE